MSSRAPSGDPMVGRTIAQYEVLARVGGGGMGVVYRARDTRLGRIVALKFLPQQWSHDETARLRFLREAQAASATNHPNICTVHDIQTADDGQLFIVMAYYEGQTLKQRLEGGPLPIDEALDLATQIADGLAKAHAQGIVHRDMKPGNVILTEDGVRIVDFGLATFADALKLTIEHSTLGTAAYMSPEQVRGESADARSDVWAAGVMLYEMLAGHVPFQGSHTEAIAYAVRHESPRPLRGARPEVPEEVEQLVFRAMHKEVSIRYQNGRDLARALRQVRGLTLPVTEPVRVLPPGPRRIEYSHPARRKWAAVAVAVVLALAGSVAWVFWPVERTSVAIVPVVNGTGYAELDRFRLALTYAITQALSESRPVRVIGHDQLSSIVETFHDRGRDISSGELVQALKTHTGARVLIAVSIVNDGAGFRARVGFRNSETLTENATYETVARASTIVSDTAFRLMAQVAAGIEAHFVEVGPLRARLAQRVRNLVGRESTTPMLPVQTPEAMRALEQGVEAYEDLEYVAALQHFESASKDDPLNPLPVAWQSRVAAVLRRDIQAEQLGRQTLTLLTEQTPPQIVLFAQAIAAEARRDAVMAEEKYRALQNRTPDDPVAVLEFAAFQDRQGRNLDAISSYHRALALDGRLPRPRVELCRLYNRINQPVDAREHARRAVSAYSGLGARRGQTQALFCLVDALRVGDDAQREEAIANARTALKLAQDTGYSYNIPRAYNYVALALEAQGKLDEAAKMWEQALVATKEAGNVVLEPLVLMNLGATHANLGRLISANEYLRRSTSGFEALRDRSRAAESQLNRGALLIQYGGDAEEGMRLVQDALEVFRQLENRNFEVVAALVFSTYYLHSGRYKDAERELNRALNLASERDLDTRSITTSIRLAQTRLATGQYDAARMLLTEALPRAPVQGRLEAMIHLARTNVRLGAFEMARTMLADVQRSLTGDSDRRLLPLLHLALGELEYQSGQFREARRHFSDGSAYLIDEMPNEDALRARAFAGFLEALDGQTDSGRAKVAGTLDVAQRVGYRSMEAQCRVLLAQIEIRRQRFREAQQALAAVPPDDDSQAIDRELRAEVLYWSAKAWAGMGDAARATEENAATRERVSSLAQDLSEQYRPQFLARPLIAQMLE